VRASTSLEGLTPTRVSLRSLENALIPRLSTYSPDKSIKCYGTLWAFGSKENPRHAGPLTLPGNHIPMLFH
jgi:hypothetical protein